MRVDPTNDTLQKSELIFMNEKEALSGVGSTSAGEFQICLIFKTAVVLKDKIYFIGSERIQNLGRNKR